MAVQTFLQSAINEVLPDLAEASKDILKETLQSLGVETHDDFQFIVEEDLLSALRPIQARKALAAWKFRCQTPETSRSSSNASPDTPPSQLSVSSNSSSSNQTSAADWVDTFEITWEKFSEELMQSSERGKRPSPKMRKKMIRIVVSEIMRKSSYLGKRSSTEVAKKMVAKYPKSLQDVIDGDVIGPGNHSLVKHLQYQIDNVKRSTMPKIRKRKRCSENSDTDEIPPEQRAAIQDTYGCINWNVKSLPLGETAESQQQKKDKLKMKFLQKEANPKEMKLLLRTTFYSQRKDINQGESIQDVLEAWPLLFHDIGMAVHYKELTGLGLKETFMRNMNMKGKRLLNYMNTVCVNKNKRFFQAQTKLMMVNPASMLNDSC
ncbi:hypothetical protein CHARACLAT_029620 [Characodon lateralis]|uniref:Uncharacterized protein n=1 Tax=Characodon lateralis TaxID=208331 RepID=A0ABU7EXY4_9TELE|nr:hypothetical protein [Characodon lateralis]